MMRSSFRILNIIQFMAAINENLFKLLAAYFLIYEFGISSTSRVMAYVGAIFILPFLLFSNLGGIFADKWPKNRIIIGTRLFEFITLLVGILFFWFEISIGAYVILFLMATFSAIFGPSKYGIIPELNTPKNLLSANSVIAAYTYFGIIIGTTLASFTVEITGSHYVDALLVSVLLAFFGLILSFFLPKTAVPNQQKLLRFFIYGEIWDAIKQMRSIPRLFSTTFAYAYFLFLGAFLQLNVIPYTTQILHMSDTIGGYFFLITALGLGLGSYFIHFISKNESRLEFIPLSGTGISLILFCMYWLNSPWWLIIIWMLVLGIFGGMFIVPPQTFILAKSPEKDRGRNFATASFFSFFFALLASLAIYLLNTLLNLSPATSGLVIGVLNLLVMTPYIIQSIK